VSWRYLFIIPIAFSIVITLCLYDVLAKRSHNFDDKVTDMTCLPDNLAARTYYQPTDRGFEQRFALASTKSVS
jgi:hypothetical protein